MATLANITVGRSLIGRDRRGLAEVVWEAWTRPSEKQSDQETPSDCSVSG
jgi:hypothetical protein